ncbi:hypothetical protein GCM10011581_48410 [Saccharopolyspora subtropica]|uniref:Uncharacterized protein n=1 Tax=Saccharopolyspora thermophila TaxID=89367 RepID=A0A917K9D8_9PSEU|nr:hypothetical protein GCM10011581_48410 [Saccharopolyspora subtropica]
MVANIVLGLVVIASVAVWASLYYPSPEWPRVALGPGGSSRTLPRHGSAAPCTPRPQVPYQDAIEGFCDER